MLWVAALVIQAGSPLCVRLGGRFELQPAHFAERHGALLIVAIGESVAAIGIGAAAASGSAPELAAAGERGPRPGALGHAVVDVFGSGDDERGERVLTRGEQRAAHPASARRLFLRPIPLLLGLVATAAGVAAIGRPGPAAPAGPPLPASVRHRAGGVLAVGAAAVRPAT